jgi:hypothetical protein
MNERIIQLSGVPHPQARIDSVDAANGVCSFAWLDADGRQVDSGGSIARFEPAEPDEDGAYPELDDATLAAAIENPPAEPPNTIFDYTEFCAHCDSRVPGFTARILTAAQSSAAVLHWVNVAVSRNKVHLDSPDLADAFALFVAAGLMTEVERVAIVTP